MDSVRNAPPNVVVLVRVCSNVFACRWVGGKLVVKKLRPGVGLATNQAAGGSHGAIAGADGQRPDRTDVHGRRPPNRRADLARARVERTPHRRMENASSNDSNRPIAPSADAAVWSRPSTTSPNTHSRADRPDPVTRRNRLRGPGCSRSPDTGEAVHSGLVAISANLPLPPFPAGCRGVGGWGRGRV